METKKILDKNGLEYYTGKIKQQIPKKTSDLTNDSNFIDNTYHDSSKQDILVSGTNIKTINNQSLLGSGNIDTTGGQSTVTDVRINGTTITDDSVANIITESAYNASTNKIATMSDLPPIVEGITTLTGSTINIYDLSNGLYRVPLNCTLYYTSTNYFTASREDGYLFVNRDYYSLQNYCFIGNDRIITGNTSYNSGSYNEFLNNSKIANNLTTAGNGNYILDAYQGKVLKDLIDGIKNGTSIDSFSDVETALNSKANALVSGTNIKTINNESILGSGNIDIEAGACVEQSSTAPTDADIVLWIEDSDIDGSGGGGGTSIEVIDSLISDSSTNALSANQGRILNGKITTIESDYLTSTNVKDNLITDSATDVLSAKQGKLLDTRISALEGENLDSRLDTLESQNLDSRLDTIEAKSLVK